MKKILPIALCGVALNANAAITGSYISSDGMPFSFGDISATSFLTSVEQAASSFVTYTSSNNLPLDTAKIAITDSINTLEITFAGTQTCYLGSQVVPLDSCFSLSSAWSSGAASTSPLTLTEQQDVNAINDATTIGLQLNRSTTQISNSLQSLRNLRSDTNKQKNGSAGDDSYSMVGPFGFFANAGGSWGHVNSRGNSNGFSLYNRNFNTAFDLKINDHVAAGILFGYTSSAAELDAGQGRFDTNIFRFSPFVTLSPTENTYIDLAAGYAKHDNQSARSCQLCGSGAKANFETDEFNILVGTGYTHSMGAWSLRGYGNAASIYMDIGGYQETGTGSAVGLLRVPNQYVVSVTSTFGVELTYAWSLPYGVLTPRITGEWVREYANDRRVTSAFTQSGIPISITANASEQDWGNMGAGLQLNLPNGLSANIGYQALIMSGSYNHALDGGIRLEF